MYFCAVFERELELYNNEALEGILPAVVKISTNDDREACTSWGYTFPPFIIVERGESLNEWCSRVQPDFATTLFVLLHVAKRLHKLHAAGLCHRDLKPANILWLPLTKCWTLIDFGCTAPIGALAACCLRS
jgi:serine/threonine protein kinase